MGLRLEKASNVAGWMYEAELQFLAETAQKSKVIIEIGSYEGRSTRALADNSPDDARIYAVDPWNFYITSSIKSNDITFNQFYLNLYSYIKQGKVIPCRKTWKEYQPIEKADFIFIDGEHTYDAVRHDIYKALLWINEGGILAGHDYRADFPGIVKVIDEEFPKFNLIDSIWWMQL
jgi:predicted O-methyltransferase YrrM